jgi:hypothetical protein
MRKIGIFLNPQEPEEHGEPTFIFSTRYLIYDVSIGGVAGGSGSHFPRELSPK